MTKIDIGIGNRKEVLITSLVIEQMTTAFISGLLGIKDAQNSRILGNKSGCLSFNQKVDLLIDLGALSPKDKGKFQAFMEIRNQFMHNLSATSYEKCLSFTNGTDKYILKNYPQSSSLTKEEALKAATGELIDDIGRLTVNIINKLKEKFNKDAEFDLSKKSRESFLKAVIQIQSIIDDYVAKNKEKNQTTNAEWLNGLGEMIGRKFMDLWTVNFKST